MTAFYFLSGGGNDFIAVVEPGSELEPHRIRTWCRRGLSLGADGVFVLSRQGARVRMEYSNADGQPAALCLNGSRCAAVLAFHLGWARDSLCLETGAGPLDAVRLGGEDVRLTLPWLAPEPEPRTVPAMDGAVAGWLVDTGVPHFVVDWGKGLRAAPVGRLGAALRRHPDFGAAGTNVDFVRFAHPQRMEIRSFERGVEAETLACGTGVLAAAAVGTAAGLAGLPLTALTAGGFELTVNRDAAGVWSLSGDARLVASGELLAGAEHLPQPPVWSS